MPLFETFGVHQSWFNFAGLLFGTSGSLLLALAALFTSAVLLLAACQVRCQLQQTIHAGPWKTAHAR